MNSKQQISLRKDQHIQLALQDKHQGVELSPFEKIQFEHRPLPELALDDVVVRSEFLGRSITAPIMIGAMTGGCDQGERINRHLAEAAQAYGVPMALGSQRAALELQHGYNIRHYAPSAILLGNLGGTQLQQGGLELAQRAVDAIQADALVIHLNPLQELVQPNGDRDWRQVLEAIAHTVANLGVPVVVKEVGAGIGPTTACQLAEVGVRFIDIAGRGGTNWASIELARNGSALEQEIAKPFTRWGSDTADLLPAVKAACPDLLLIGSGGVRHGIDVARCLRLGANMTALAHYFLPAALESTQAVIDKLFILEQQLRWTLFLTGSPDLAALTKAPLCNANG